MNFQIHLLNTGINKNKEKAEEPYLQINHLGVGKGSRAVAITSQLKEKS
jgi:hypothetical protein